MASVANVSLESHKTRRWQTDAERRNAYRRDAESRFHFCEHDPREATRHVSGKPTPSVVTSRHDADSEQQTKPRITSGSDMERC
jgi:hypothetical protein